MEQYISKFALLKKIKEIMNEQQEICKADVALGKKPNSKNIEIIYQFQQFIKFLNTLEVKEVDLEKEIGKYLDTNNIEFSHQIKLFEFAKHFFELGMSVSNKVKKVE